MKNEFIIEENMIMKYVGIGGDVIIPQGVKDIFFETFYGNNLITSITIPGSILDITPFVFERCKNLKIVKICEGVSSINIGAFNECEGLECIYLPSSLKLIKMNAFANCSSLKKIYYKGTKEEWDLIIKEDNWNENTNNYEIILWK